MYSALTLVFLLGSASAETRYIRNATKLAEPVDGVNPLIVGGGPVTAYEHTWVLKWEATDEKAGKLYSCGASLIHREWAMTALHCTNGFAASQMKVHVYHHNPLGDDHRCTETLNVAEKFEHPDSKSMRGGDYVNNDVALLRLSSAVKCDGSMKMPKLDDGDVSRSSCEGTGEACIVGAYGRGPGGEISTTATVAGWGSAELGGPLSNVLQSADLKLLSNLKCENFYLDPSYDSIIDDSMICAISCPEILPLGLGRGRAYEVCVNQDKDSCRGDSGGPLFVQQGGVDIIVGIVSWGDGCKNERVAGVYARVSSFKSWIEETTKGAVAAGLCPKGKDQCVSQCRNDTKKRCKKNCGDTPYEKASREGQHCIRKCRLYFQLCKKTCALCEEE